MDHPTPVKRADLVLINKKKRTHQLGDFAVPADHRAVIPNVRCIHPPVGHAIL